MRRVLICCLGLGAFLVGAVAASDGKVLGSGRGPEDLTITDTGRVSYSATVRPAGRPTAAFFQYGLGSRYREPRPPGVVYDESTPILHLRGDFGTYRIFGRASKLVPNALYHVRLVASSAAGTVHSPDTTFVTAKDPPPPTPRIGATLNLQPISGLVLIEPPPSTPAGTSQIARLTAGQGFLPLTENRQRSIDGQIDARAGALMVVVASPRAHRTQRVRVAGGLLSVTQPRNGPDRGLSTLDLHVSEFAGAPTYSGCAQTPAGPSARRARTAQADSTVLQTVRASDQAGRFRTRDRDSVAMAGGAGTVWDTIQRCDGTLTVVRRGTVIVSDLGLGSTIAVQAGQSYLAQAR